MAQPATTLLVEDDLDLRESLVEALELEGVPLRAVGTAREFLEELAAAPCEVAIVDLSLPDGSGLDLVEHLRLHCAARIVVLTARGSLQDRVEGYAAGADLYLVKPADPRELAAAVRSLAARVPTGRAPAAEAAWHLDRSAWSLVAPDGRTLSLTGKERRFLELLLTHPQQVVPRPALCEALGYFDDATGKRALDALVLRLRRKTTTHLGLSPIRTAHGEGYAFAYPCR